MSRDGFHYRSSTPVLTDVLQRFLTRSRPMNNRVLFHPILCIRSSSRQTHACQGGTPYMHFNRESNLNCLVSLVVAQTLNWHAGSMWKLEASGPKCILARSAAFSLVQSLGRCRCKFQFITRAHASLPQSKKPLLPPSSSPLRPISSFPQQQQQHSFTLHRYSTVCHSFQTSSPYNLLIIPNLFIPSNIPLSECSSRPSSHARLSLSHHLPKLLNGLPSQESSHPLYMRARPSILNGLEAMDQ